MKSQTAKKIEKILKSRSVTLNFCTSKNKICINGAPISNVNLIYQPFYNDIKTTFALTKDNTIALITEYATMFPIDSTARDAEIKAKKEEEKTKKEQELAEEKAKKAQEKAEAKAKKEQELAEEKAKKAQEKAEAKAKKEQELAEAKARKIEEHDRKSQKRIEEIKLKEQIRLAKENAKLEREQTKQNEINDRIDKLKNGSEWEKLMKYNSDGFIDPYSKANLYNYLKYNDDYKGKFKFNEFSGLETYEGELIEEHKLTAISLDTERDINQSRNSTIAEITGLICHENTYHPLKQALSQLIWDGVPRMRRYLIDYIGAADTKLTEDITEKCFYAMMERLHYPGCKFDHMWIVYDETHGTGKTTIICCLLEALRDEFNMNDEDCGVVSLNELGFDKDTVQCLNKALFAYVDELAKFLKEDPEEVKKFITQTNDNARLAYGKFNKNYPRHCILYGSTNTKDFIKDTTDSYERRFWIVDCNGEKHESGIYWKDKLPHNIRLQILAEAYHFWCEKHMEGGYEYNDLDEEDTLALMEVQKKHMTANRDDVLSDKIITILDFNYDKETYDTYYQWRNEAISMWQNYTSGNSFGLISDENDELLFPNLPHKITKIPVLWVKKFIQEELGRAINDDNYINRLIASKWYKNKNAIYVVDNKQIRNCYIRI